MARYFTILDAILPSNHGITKNDFQIENKCVQLKKNWTEQTILVVRRIIKGNKFQDGNTHK